MVLGVVETEFPILEHAGRTLAIVVEVRFILNRVKHRIALPNLRIVHVLQAVRSGESSVCVCKLG